MLRSLHIRNWALAENLEIDFQPHLNILTGETGAGKSILVGAIAAVLGGRTFTEVVRTGHQSAHVEAVFEISKLPHVKRLLQEKGIDAGDDLLLRREISVKSSSRAFINDRPVTMATLAEIGNYLLDIHGQHEHQRLLNRETHRQFLDALGQLSPALKIIGEQFSALKSIKTNLTSLLSRQKELNDKHELTIFQFQEIEKAALSPDEEETLKAEQKFLANTEKLFEISSQLQTLFSGEDDANLLNAIGQADQQLRSLTEFAKDLKNLHEEFSSAKIVMEETARSIEEFQSQLEFDPERLEIVEARLDLISRLKKKYGPTIEGVLAHQEELRKSLDLQQNFDFEIEKLRKELAHAISVYSGAAAKLSKARKKAAAKMETVVQEQLILLGMPNIRFKVMFERQEDPQGIFKEDGILYYGDEFGIDQMEFYISPNPGEDFKPLSKIASGGEISRIMLALKGILADIDDVPTLIFDEIDHGVSGRVAQAVGKSIYNLGQSHQILCITHLAQIAAYGEAHFAVEKYVENGRTFTQINPLKKKERVKAIAYLMAGENITDNVLQSAKQLIKEGRGEKAEKE